MKKIRFSSNARTDVRAIDQQMAMGILSGLHRYAKTGHGDVKALEGDLAGLLRLCIGNCRVLFDGTKEAIHVHRVRDRREAYG